MGKLGKALFASVCALAIGSPSIARADTPFAAGSLIIPAGAPYQNDCGAVSMYGLVYNILRANTYLENNRATPTPAGLALPGNNGKIEVYYSFKPTKASPNRCTPTNLHHGIPYGAGVAPGPVFPASLSSATCDGGPSPCAPHDDPKWNDGCDFEVFSNAVTPVKLVNKSNILPVNDTLITTRDTSANVTVFPQWIGKVIQNTGVAATHVNTVRYWGGSFIISSEDATTLLKLLDGSLVAQDSAGNAIDFAPFKLGSCTYNTTQGGDVAIHRAGDPFTAPTPKIFTLPPPRLALLTDDALNNTGTVSDGFLQKYLTNAGLNFPGARGCPTGGYHAANTTLCPGPNFGTPGQIYDRFDLEDLRLGRLAAVSGGEPVYKMFWAPHWSLKTPGSGPNSQESTVMNNLNTYLDGQRGLMGMCASIEAWEGTLVGSNVLNPSISHPNSHFQTCRDNSGSCGGTAENQGMSINSGGGNDAAGNTACGGGGAGPCTAPRGRLRNCSDPDVATNAQCSYFSNPGDSFGQTADYRWHSHVFASGSSVSDFRPRAGASIYRPGVAVLVSGVSNLDKSKLGDPTIARGMIRGDLVTRNFKDNNPAKSSILYLGDHDQSASVAGTKVVLQTLLQLGDSPVIPVMREVTRSNPILATIDAGGSVIVQGTFEQITPAPVTKTAMTDAEAPNFEFPFYLGHMRAIRASQVAVAGVAFKDLLPAAVVFDAADGIPAVTFAGCGTNFAGTCRTVFTNSGGGQGPGNVFLRTGDNAARIDTNGDGTADQTLRDAIAPTVTCGTPTCLQDTVIQRVLKGSPDPANPGQYLSKLGGIDHSTVAVVDPSIVAGSSSRPRMIYVGSTDGMMHAICASVAVAFGCDAVGRELWAFVPRMNLKRLRKNTARIDGSPRVLDLFGDFDPTDGITRRSFKTVMIFQTGAGDPTLADETPGVYAMDVTVPNAPKVLWEYAVAPGARGTTEVGQGSFVTAGTVRIGGVNRIAAFVHTNNGGTTIRSGSVLAALDVETPGPLNAAVTRFWKAAGAGTAGEFYPDPPRSAIVGDGPPRSGVVGGAIAIDKGQTGSITDVVFGNLYGEIWQLDATTGISRYINSVTSAEQPLFRFGQDKKPFGAPPALFADGGTLFVALVSGGYFDPSTLISSTLWSGLQQHMIAVSLDTTLANTPLTEASGALLKRKVDLDPSGTGEKGFSQVVVVGDQLFFTTDTTDVNTQAFGSGGDTGRLHQIGISGGSDTTTVIRGGAGSIAYDATTNEAFAGSSDSIKRITPPGGSPGAGQTTNQIAQRKIERRVWLQSL